MSTSIATPPEALKSPKLGYEQCSSSLSSCSATKFAFMMLPRRSVSPLSAIAYISPTKCLDIALKNKKIKSRIDPFSIEQAMYFEPFEEGEIDMDLLKALRSGDLEKLRSMWEDKEKKYDLEGRNQFGENLVHMACRISNLKLEVLKFLGEEVEVPVNVRDKHGRSPLHNACMSAIPNFDNVEYIMKKAPELAVFEDDKNKLPFDLIPHRCFERWTRFLCQKKFLQNFCTDLSKKEDLQASD